MVRYKQTNILIMAVDYNMRNALELNNLDRHFVLVSDPV